MQDISDEIIIKAVEGDLDAFEYIYQRSASFFYNVALRIVNRREDAEDVVQEVYMIMYKQLKSFRFDSSFKTWGYRITVNTAINYAKRASRNNHTSMDVREETHVPVQASTLQLDENSKNDMVEKLLEILNVEQKACIILRSQQGLSYEEISQTLGIPINTVRSRIKRAREAMMKFKNEVISHEM